MPLYEESLEMRRELFGDGSPVVAHTLNNFGQLLHWMGRYDEARSRHKESSLAIWRATLGSDHTDVATPSMSTWVRHGAVPDPEVSDRPRRRRFTAKYKLASLLNAQGDFEAARPLTERSLEITRAAFGDQHPDVAMRIDALAQVHHVQGEYDAAQALYEESLACGGRWWTRTIHGSRSV